MFEVSSSGPITRIRMARTLAGRTLHEVSAYWVGGILVDSGPPPLAARMASWCRRQGVERVVLTHHHEDHVGGAAAIQTALQIPVLAPTGALPILLEGARIPPYRRLFWGTPRCLRALPLGDELIVGDLRFQVISTPGHAFDHVCLFEPERGWLFSGDLYVHPRVRFLRRIEDVWAHLSSLRRVLNLDPQLMLCAHAGVVEDARGALESKIQYWEELAGRSRELADQGMRVREITRRLLGPPEAMEILSLGDFSKANLIRDLLRTPSPPLL